MSPNGLFPLHPVARVEPRYQPPRPDGIFHPCRELITSVPHRPPMKGASIQCQGSWSLRSGMVFRVGPDFFPVEFDALPCRTGQSSRGSCGGCCLSAAFSRAAKRILLRVTIHKMAAPPVYAGNTTICAVRFKERDAITSGRGCRARRRGRDSARGSLWRGTSAGVCGG